MKRRSFLRKTGAGLGATGMMTSVSCGTKSELERGQIPESAILAKRIQGPQGELGQLPDSRKEKRKVCIIGGGIAGLSAALELAERNYDVTLKEAESYLGGRLHTRQEVRAGENFAVEHGLHMWFYQYFNFQNILERLGVWETQFRDFKEVYFEFKPPLSPEVIKSEGPYPLNLVKLLANSPNLNFLDAAGVIGAIGDVVFYRHENNVKKLDKITFEEWMERGRVNEKFRNVVLRPAASVTLNDPEKVSAAEMVMFQHLYFLGHPKAFHRKVTITDHESAVIGPWAERLRALGVSIELESPVKRLILKDDKVTGVEGKNGVEEYDEVILGLDVPGLKSILNASTVEAGNSDHVAALRAVQNKVNQLKVAPQYSVLRVWFDKPTDPKRPFEQSVIESSEFKPINLLAIMNMLEDESAEWAQRTGGSVVEFHLYNTPEFNGLSAGDVWDQIAEIALDLLPELRESGAKAIDFSLGQFENFTSYEVGQATVRPMSDYPRQVGIQNLSWCGDCINTSFPSALMERAVSTGREAANLILAADGVSGQDLVVAESKGPGLLPRL